jgi:polysaccharide export outer membrane protein
MILALALSALVQAAPASATQPQAPPADVTKPAEAPAVPDPQSASPDDAAAGAPATEGDYEVGAGDVLEINVFGNDDLSRVPTIQTNGAVSLLINPQVEVKVKEYQSQYVSVVGEVNNPGRKPIRGRMRLLDALIESGGFKTTSSGEVMITRTDGSFDDGKKAITVRISQSATIQDTINLELRLKNGDIISALPKSFVTVDGEVNRPGRYAIESDLTVTGAVSLAGGRTRFGSGSVKLRRIDPQSGKVSVIEVDIKDVQNGKKPDVAVLPNDVVSVSRRVF